MTSENYWHAFGEIETITGAYFRLAQPEFDIEAIAHGAARKCRFNGQCRYFYPVANHAVMVSRIMERLGGDPMGAAPRRERVVSPRCAEPIQASAS